MRANLEDNKSLLRFLETLATQTRQRSIVTSIDQCEQVSKT